MKLNDTFCDNIFQENIGVKKLLICLCYFKFLICYTALKHETDGRVIVAEFESFRLVNTYVPNNGWKDDENGFKRRRKWDQRMLDFVLRVSDKPLIWCGDLNVR